MSTLAERQKAMKKRQPRRAGKPPNALRHYSELPDHAQDQVKFTALMMSRGQVRPEAISPALAQRFGVRIPPDTLRKWLVPLYVAWDSELGAGE